MNRPPLSFLLFLSCMVLLSIGVMQTGMGVADVSASTGTRGESPAGREPSTVIVSPEAFFVVHATPQMSNHPLTLQNTRVFSVQFTIAEAAESCDEPGSVPWISIAPSVGTIPAGGTREVIALFASEGLPAGWNTAFYCITTTDPQSELIEVPINLHVGPLPTATATATATPTATGVPSTNTATATATPTGTFIPPTSTATPTATTTTVAVTLTSTATATPTITNTPPTGATLTPTSTATATYTVTPGSVVTSTPTATTTITPEGSGGIKLYLPMIRRR